MKRVVGILLVVLFVMLVAGFNARQAWAATSIEGWNKTYGGTGDDDAYALVKTSDGGYALAGFTNSFGAGIYDFWLVKTDASGNMLWNQTYGGTGINEAYDLVQTNDGGYALAGYTNPLHSDFSYFWLVKTDASGNMMWNQTFGGPYARAYALVHTNDGGYALAGITSPSGAGGDFWLVKTDASGNMQWNQTYGGTGDNEAKALVQTSDGGYALAGYTGNITNHDFWLVKTDASGNMLWNQTYGGTGINEAYALVQTGDGGYALAGYTGGGDFWLVKTGVSGNMQWNKTYGGQYHNEAHALVQTSDGGYALAGWTLSDAAVSPDFWLVKTDVSGNMQWNQTYEGPSGSDYAYALVQTNDGGYAIAGTTNIGFDNLDFRLIKTDAIGVVPEFPSSVVVAVLVGVTTLTIILAKRKSRACAIEGG